MVIIDIPNKDIAFFPYLEISISNKIANLNLIVNYIEIFQF